MKYDYIIWDFNGTIADDAQIAVDCVNDILDLYCLPRTNLTEYREMFVFPVTDYYAKLIDMTKHGFDEIARLFGEGYQSRISEISLADGAEKVFEYVAQQGCGQAIVSSFEGTRLNALVRQFGIEKYFDVISGAGDIFVGSKSQRAAAVANGKGRVLFVGDSESDLDAARICNADCVLVAYGHQGTASLKKTGCAVIDKITDLIHYI